nr:NADH dehydrogenase subunit 6 [Pachypanchax playfairii]
MTYMMFLLSFALILGVTAVASNPSPYFGALGLVVMAGFGCGALVACGGSFLSLILFLIYLGGMLVVFAYSAALAAEPYPEGWGSLEVLLKMMGYMVGTGGVCGVVMKGWYEGSWLVVGECEEFFMMQGDFSGIALLYSAGGGFLVMGVGGLLLALFVALELTRGLSRGALREV